MRKSTSNRSFYNRRVDLIRRDAVDGEALVPAGLAADEADRPPRHAARGGHQLDERVVRRALHGWSGHADQEGIVADAEDFGLA